MSATVLYIDDNPYMLDLVSAMLEVEGYTVFSASDGLTGLSILTSNHPDVVLVDVAMPLMNGHEVCQLIREQEGFQQLPLVMLSASTGLGDRMIARNNQVNGYLTKPCSRDELVSTIAQVVQVQRDKLFA